MDPRAGARGAPAAAGVPRREVAGRRGCTTATSTRARPASATSSTAAPRCTWHRSASSTPATRTGAYAEAIELAGAHQSSYGREAAGVFAAAVAEAMRPGATRRLRGRHGAAAGPRRHARRDRGGLPSGRAARHDWDGPFERAARRGRARSTRSATTYRDPASAPAGPAACTAIEELPRRARASCSSPAATTARPCSARVNYGRDADSIATHGRRHRRGARRHGGGSRATGGRPSPRQPHRPGRRRAPAMAAVAAAASAPPTRPRRPRATRRAAPRRAGSLVDDPAHLGPAGGPARPRARASRRRTAVDVADIATRWLAAGGRTTRRPGAGASPDPPPPKLRDARPMRTCSTSWRSHAVAVPREPDELDGPSPSAPRPGPRRRPSAAAYDRLHGAWLGRAAGCLLGKPVEKIPRDGHPGDRRGDRALADRRLVHRRRAARTRSAALAVEPPQRRHQPRREHRRHARGRRPQLPAARPATCSSGTGGDFTTDDVAQAWLDELPGGRVFTAERVAYRNLLAGVEPAGDGRRTATRSASGSARRSAPTCTAGRTPETRRRAARLAWPDARLSHTANGLYGAMFVAAMAVGGRGRPATCDEVLDAGPVGRAAGSRSPRPSRYGRGRSRRGRSTSSGRSTRCTAAYGHLHWVHALNNAALVAVRAGARRRRLRTGRSPRRSPAAGTPTPTAPRSARSPGALLGAAAPARRHGRRRCATGWPRSMPGFDGIGFDELARRTQVTRLALRSPATQAAARG